MVELDMIAQLIVSIVGLLVGYISARTVGIADIHDGFDLIMKGLALIICAVLYIVSVYGIVSGLGWA